MSTWFDFDGDASKPVLLKTPEQILLREIMVALKQTRSELNGIRRVMAACAKKDGVEVQDAD